MSDSLMVYGLGASSYIELQVLPFVLAGSAMLKAQKASSIQLRFRGFVVLSRSCWIRRPGAHYYNRSSVASAFAAGLKLNQDLYSRGALTV